MYVCMCSASENTPRRTQEHQHTSRHTFPQLHQHRTDFRRCVNPVLNNAQRPVSNDTRGPVYQGTYPQPQHS